MSFSRKPQKHWQTNKATHLNFPREPLQQLYRHRTRADTDAAALDAMPSLPHAVHFAVWQRNEMENV